MKNGTSEFKQSKILGVSPQAFCKYVSAALICIGLIFLTKIYMPVFWVVTKTMEHPSVAARLTITMAIILALGTALYKFPIFKHFVLYVLMGIISFIGIVKLGAWPGYSGEPYVSIWAPILIQLGVISLIICKIRQQRLGIEKATETFVNYQGLFLAMLFGSILVYAASDYARHWEDGYHMAVERIKSLHEGQDFAPAETKEFNGIKFRCYIINGTAKCDGTN